MTKYEQNREIAAQRMKLIAPLLSPGLDKAKSSLKWHLLPYAGKQKL